MADEAAVGNNLPADRDRRRGLPSTGHPAYFERRNVGKPYAKELDALEKTYAWSIKVPVDRLAYTIDRLRPFPLLCVGSGGSLSAAAFASYMHQVCTGAISKFVTPLEAVLGSVYGPSHGVLLLSAGGGNPDVLGAAKILSECQLGYFAALCTRAQSPLARLADEVGTLDLVDFKLPCGKDGFLATNSLLAMVALVCRAYGQAEKGAPSLPGTLAELVGTSSLDEFREDIAEQSRKIWGRRSLVVLCSTATLPAALDFESKCTEAALCNVQVADYRNFAHGRHHWIAKEETDTAVVAFVTTEVRKIASLTLGALPRSVPTISLDVGHEGPQAAVSAMMKTLYLIGAAGVAKKVDPGRPHVPPFGRKIYHLKAFPKLAMPNGISRREEVSIIRKSGRSISALERCGELDKWKEFYHAFVDRLSRAELRAVVVDYDGTLCDPTERFGAPDRALVKRLAEFIKAGIKVGVVTGRGQSVRSALQKAFAKGIWGKVLVGYYNGAIVRPLDSNADLRTESPAGKELADLASALLASSRLEELATIESRPFQISIQPKSEEYRPRVWELVQQNLFSSPGVRLVESGHSIDAIAPGVSKRRIVSEISEQLGGRSREHILCIGDSGRWPGNDFELLAEPNSLSVAAVSGDPEQCWNIALPEHRLISATQEYICSLLTLRKGRLAFGGTRLGGEK